LRSSRETWCRTRSSPRTHDEDFIDIRQLAGDVTVTTRTSTVRITARSVLAIPRPVATIAVSHVRFEIDAGKDGVAAWRPQNTAAITRSLREDTAGWRIKNGSTSRPRRANSQGQIAPRLLAHEVLARPCSRCVDTVLTCG